MKVIKDGCMSTMVEKVTCKYCNAKLDEITPVNCQNEVGGFTFTLV